MRRQPILLFFTVLFVTGISGCCFSDQHRADLTFSGLNVASGLYGPDSSDVVYIDLDVINLAPETVRKCDIVDAEPFVLELKVYYRANSMDVWSSPLLVNAEDSSVYNGTVRVSEPGLASGDTLPHHFIFGVENQGEYKVNVLVDADDEVYEEDETNNGN